MTIHLLTFERPDREEWIPLVDGCIGNVFENSDNTNFHSDKWKFKLTCPMGQWYEKLMSIPVTTQHTYLFLILDRKYLKLQMDIFGCSCK
jgi:hypothetical protein